MSNGETLKKFPLKSNEIISFAINIILPIHAGQYHWRGGKKKNYQKETK